MNASFFENSTQKLTLLLRAAGLKGRQVVEAIRVTTEGLIEDLKAEINKGNYKEVITFLGTNAIVWGRSALLDRLTKKVASRLMLRLGLPGAIAAGAVTLLLPFVLMKLRKKALEKKDAGEFLETFDLQGDQELQGKVQQALEQETLPNEETAKEAPADKEVAQEPKPEV
jgi:hypothetical protein